MTGDLNPWQEIADACCEHDTAHLRRALNELIPPPRYEECGTTHTRPGGERVVCAREAGHPGRHVGLATTPLHFTWDSPALTAALSTPDHACLGCNGNCAHAEH